LTHSLLVDGTSFIIFHITTLNDEWSLRNRARSERQRIADDVASKIASRFEAPHTTNDDWEAHATLTILTLSNVPSNNSDNDVVTTTKLYVYVERSLHRSHPLFAAIDSVWSRPPQSVAEHDQRLLERVRFD
jgi:tRNA uridine 5-carbamoylmethylation protein Kti12